MLGPLACTFQSLTSLSVEPVTRKPGMMGLMSKEETDSSCAWSVQMGFEAEGEDGARRTSWW
jgi:hypothetical protein